MIEQEIITKVIEQQSTEVQLDKEISEDYYDGEYYNVCVDCGKLVEDCYGTNCSKSKEIKEYKINISSVLSSVFNGEIINCIEKDSDGFTYELQNHFLVTIPLNQSPKERLEHIFRKGKIHLILNSDIELNSTFCFPIRVKQVSKNIQTLENIHKSRKQLIEIFNQSLSSFQGYTYTAIMSDLTKTQIEKINSKNPSQVGSDFEDHIERAMRKFNLNDYGVNKTDNNNPDASFEKEILQKPGETTRFGIAIDAKSGKTFKMDKEDSISKMGHYISTFSRGHKRVLFYPTYKNYLDNPLDYIAYFRNSNNFNDESDYVVQMSIDALIYLIGYCVQNNFDETAFESREELILCLLYPKFLSEIDSNIDTSEEVVRRVKEQSDCGYDKLQYIQSPFISYDVEDVQAFIEIVNSRSRAKTK